MALYTGSAIGTSAGFFQITAGNANVFTYITSAIFSINMNPMNLSFGYADDVAGTNYVALQKASGTGNPGMFAAIQFTPPLAVPPGKFILINLPTNITVGYNPQVSLTGYTV